MNSMRRKKIVLTPEQVAQFRAKVKTGADNQCWPWTGYVEPYTTPYDGGYGKFCRWKAHRVAYTLRHGPIPEDKILLHSCDCRVCCNPAHLHLATHLDNNRDAARKGRMAAGARNGKVTHPGKINAKVVLEILEKYQEGTYSQKALGVEYGVSQTTIGNIVRRKTWPHVGIQLRGVE